MCHRDNDVYYSNGDGRLSHMQQVCEGRLHAFQLVRGISNAYRNKHQ